MKNQDFKILVAMLCFAGVFTACENDDEKDTKTLVGTWKVAYDERKDCDDAVFNHFNGYTSCTTDCIQFTFTKDGKTIEVYGNGTFTTEGTYTISGNQVFLCLDFIYTCEDFTFKIDGSALTLTYDDMFGCTNVVVLNNVKK